METSLDEKKILENFEKLIEATRKYFILEGGVPSIVYIGYRSEGKIGLSGVPVDVFMQSVEGKERLSHMMRQISKFMEPICICMCSEVWYLEGKSGDKEELMKNAPSKSPDKKEGLMFTFESEHINKMYMFRITRNGDKAILGEDNIGKDVGSSEGRFSNVLADMKKVKNN